MRQKPMVSHPDSPTARDPPGDGGGDQIRPAKGEQRTDCHNMKSRHEKYRDPLNFIRFNLIYFSDVLHFVIPLFG